MAKRVDPLHQALQSKLSARHYIHATVFLHFSWNPLLLRFGFTGFRPLRLYAHQDRETQTTLQTSKFCHQVRRDSASAAARRHRMPRRRHYILDQDLASNLHPLSSILLAKYLFGLTIFSVWQTSSKMSSASLVSSGRKPAKTAACLLGSKPVSLG